MTQIKKIKGFKGYFVTDSGNILSERHGGFKWLKPNKIGLVNLCANGECKPMKVHRLVAMAFVPVPEKYKDISIDELDIHHIDHNRKNNRTSNLQWLTKTEHQQLHSDSDVTKQRKSEALKGKLLTEEHKQRISEAMKGKLKGRPKPEGAGKQPKQVIQFTKNGDFVASYASIAEAERLTKINNSHICECCNGNRNSAGGFNWKYAA